MGRDEAGGRENSDLYYLTPEGKKRWRRIFDNTPDMIIKINNKIRGLQMTKTVDVLKQVYRPYPEYLEKTL